MNGLKSRIVNAAKLLELQLLCFALLVPLLAMAAFVCGGTCAQWQWWVAAFIVTATGFVNRDWRDAAAGAVMFGLWMASVWILCGTFAGFGGYDEQAYHVPAVRLLVNGWNPLEIRTSEQFMSSFGFAAGDINQLHVLFQMKVVWIFNAVAAKFTGDFFTPMLPFTLAIFPAAVIRLMRSVRPNGLRLLGVALLYWMMPRGEYAIDDALTLAVTALMMAMHGVLSGKKPRIMELCAWTLVSVTVKLNGIIFTGVIWMLFLVFALVKRMPWKPYLWTLLLAGAVFVPLTITPFVTAAIDCGHPLYPHCAGDEAHPAIDICADFLDVSNDDQKYMGRFGAFVNSYVSPALARAYYNWRLNRTDFEPTNSFFRHYPNVSKDGGRTPVHWSVRLSFWAAVVVLCLWGRERGAFVVAATLICLASVPLRMIGYIRYIPWMMAPLVFVLVEASGRKLRDRLMVSIGIVATLFVSRPLPLQKHIYEAAHEIMSSEMARAILPQLSPTRVYSMGTFKWRANFNLLCKQFRGLKSAEVIIEPTALRKRNRGKYSVFPGGHFCFAIGDGDFATVEGYRARMLESSPRRLDRCAFVARAYCVVLPRLILRRIFGVPEFHSETWR